MPKPAKTQQGPADVAVLAREAVISFLHDASKATADREAVRAGFASTDDEASVTADAGASKASGIPAQASVPGSPETMPSTASHVAAGSAGWGAAAIGVATLDRIEAAAAKVEADIRSALLAQAELQAGAGVAAEAAVRAAQASWIAARASEAAEGRARVILGVMTRYLAVTMAILLVTLIFVVITAVVAH